jgi:DNA-binding protein YbaB
MSSLPDPAAADLSDAAPAPADLIDPAHLERAEQAVRAATYEGRDPQHLVTAVVDGDGLVVRVGFGRTVGTHAADVVEQAVLAAVGAAQQRMNDAWQDLAARMQAGVPGPDDELAPFGGAEPYVEESHELR